MISALAKGYQVTTNSKYLNAAKTCAEFIKGKLMQDHFILLRRYREGEAKFTGQLEDYAFLIQGLLDLYEASFEIKWLQLALNLQEKQNELFLDKSSGAYFESIANDTSILFRSKSIYDGALPSSNAIALSNLRKFSKLTDKTSRKKSLSSQASKLVNSFATAINDNPPAAAMLLAIEVEPRKE